jgi:epoxyqueuosine reductase
MKKLSSDLPQLAARDNLSLNIPQSRAGGPSKVKAPWIEDLIADLVLGAPENRLGDFGGCLVFDRPLIGVADGDDEIFEAFSQAVSSRHLRPRQILERHSPKKRDFKDVRVISWALPFTAEVRRSNRGKTWPSPLYSIARNNGGALNYHLSRRLTAIFEKRGIAAVSPLLLDEYDAFKDPEHVISSTWSERHVAYAAGLGSFGLNESLITPAGSHVRLGSIVVDYPLDRTPRKEDGYRSRCFETGGEDCGACIKRCPAEAITERGLDKQKCYERREAIRVRFLEEYAKKYRMFPSPIAKSGKKYLGFSLGCALCQCGVPCEGTDPYLKKSG